MEGSPNNDVSLPNNVCIATSSEVIQDTKDLLNALLTSKAFSLNTRPSNQSKKNYKNLIYNSIIKAASEDSSCEDCLYWLRDTLSRYSDHPAMMYNLPDGPTTAHTPTVVAFNVMERKENAIHITVESLAQDCMSVEEQEDLPWRLTVARSILSSILLDEENIAQNKTFLVEFAKGCMERSDDLPVIVCMVELSTDIASHMTEEFHNRSACTVTNNATLGTSLPDTSLPDLIVSAVWNENVTVLESQCLTITGNNVRNEKTCKERNALNLKLDNEIVLAVVHQPIYTYKKLDKKILKPTKKNRRLRHPCAHKIYLSLFAASKTQ
jgi:hypothetical protein